MPNSENGKQKTSTVNYTRRNLLKSTGIGAAALALSSCSSSQRTQTMPAGERSVLQVEPEPGYDLSPYLYMQFMEPLGLTDGSVEAAWDFKNDRWREDVIEATKELSPSLIRWGGLLSSYYRWKEAVGPRDKRIPMMNLVWGGLETNQVGTAEFVDFCRRVGADPLMAVNFESDGKDEFKVDPKGSVRTAGPAETREWVDYCNNPSNSLRRAHGFDKPHNIKLWQLGNETSYGRNHFDLETAAKRTVVFAKEMRKADPNIELIGWGDSGWAKRMTEVAGEHLQYVAFHHMFDPGKGNRKSPLRGIEYRKDPDRTWAYLMNGYRQHEAKIKRIRAEVTGYDMPLAMTECHYSLPGRNRCEVLSTWAAGVSYARFLNVHERHGDVLKIATAADFCGTRWQVNAIMIPVPAGRSFMMPVAMVMSLYRNHTGEKAIDVTSVPDDLDVTASRTGDRVFLHVANTNRTRSVSTRLAVEGMAVNSGKVFEIAIEPEYEVFEHRPEITAPKEKSLPKNGRWTFPAASVSAVELDVQA